MRRCGMVAGMAENPKPMNAYERGLRDGLRIAKRAVWVWLALGGALGWVAGTVFGGGHG